jgi:hypothetical protein
VQRLATVSTVLCSLCRLAAVEDIDDRTVTVGGFPIEPMADLSYLDHRVELHPKALLGVGWNSNIFATDRNPDADGFYRVVAGLETRWHVTPRDRAFVDGEIDSQQYFSENQVDLVGGLGRLGWVHLGEVSTLGVHAGWERTNEPQEQTGEQISFDRSQADVELDRRGLTSHAVVGVGVDRTDYRQDSAFFGDDQRDAWRWNGRGRIGRAYATDSERYVRVRFGQTLYDHEDRFQSSVVGVLAVGVEHLVATRTVLFADLGVDARRYDDDFLHDPAYDDQQTLYPIGSAGVRWSPEALTSLQAKLVADVYDSVSANAAWYGGLDVDGRLRLRHNLFAYTESFLHQSIDSGAAAGSTPEHRTTLELAGGFGYALRDGAAGRVRLSWTDSESDVGVDWQRLLLAVEVGCVF